MEELYRDDGDIRDYKNITIYPFYVPSEESIEALECSEREGFRWRNFNERHARPWITFSKQEALQLRIVRYERELVPAYLGWLPDDKWMYSLELPSGKFLRVWPFKRFRTEFKENAEYMRLKVIALATGEPSPPWDYDYVSWWSKHGDWVLERRRIEQERIDALRGETGGVDSARNDV